MFRCVFKVFLKPPGAPEGHNLQKIICFTVFFKAFLKPPGAPEGHNLQKNTCFTTLLRPLPIPPYTYADASEWKSSYFVMLLQAPRRLGLPKAIKSRVLQLFLCFLVEINVFHGAFASS